MTRSRILSIVVVGVLAGACAQEATAPQAAISEPLLAQQSQGIAQDVLAATQTTHESLLRHTLDALHNHPNPEAEACLADARDLHHQARAAHDAGNLELAAELNHASLRKLLCAVVEVFPDALARTGAAVDEVVARIEHWLGDREAPRIREVLAHVKELRIAAEAALGEGNGVEALALNLRATQILHRLANHLAAAHDHDAVANSEMYGVDF